LVAALFFPGAPLLSIIARPIYLSRKILGNRKFVFFVFAAYRCARLKIAKLSIFYKAQSWTNYCKDRDWVVLYTAFQGWRANQAEVSPQ
jgi:hypothetical protein